MVLRKIGIRSIDGEFFGETEVDIKSEEENEAERRRLYPDTSKTSYLEYTCHYCGVEFYLINHVRSPNMNPLSDGFICIYREKYQNYYDKNCNDKDLGRLMAVCRSCLKILTDQGESITIKPWS